MNANILALSQPIKSLSFIYTIFSLILLAGLKYLTFSLGINIKIFLTQGIFSKILLTEYLSSSLSKSLYICFIHFLFNDLSLKSIYLIKTSIGSFSINSKWFLSNNSLTSNIWNIINIYFSLSFLKLMFIFFVNIILSLYIIIYLWLNIFFMIYLLLYNFLIFQRILVVLTLEFWAYIIILLLSSIPRLLLSSLNTI